MLHAKNIFFVATSDNDRRADKAKMKYKVYKIKV